MISSSRLPLAEGVRRGLRFRHTREKNSREGAKHPARLSRNRIVFFDAKPPSREGTQRRTKGGKGWVPVRLLTRREPRYLIRSNPDHSSIHHQEHHARRLLASHVENSNGIRRTLGRNTWIS